MNWNGMFEKLAVGAFAIATVNGLDLWFGTNPTWLAVAATVAVGGIAVVANLVTDARASLNHGEIGGFQ